MSRSASIRYVVKTCVARRDGAFMLTFRDGSGDRAAVCPDRLAPGQTFTLRDGPGSYPVATPTHARQS